MTTDAEGGSARPEVVAAPNRVFVVYLGNIGSGNGRRFNVKIFDANLNNVIASRTILETTAEYGGPTDIRVASDGQYLYAFYETFKPTSQTTATTYLWGAKYTLDDSFERVAYTPEPIASSKPASELQDGGETLDDPAPLVGTTSVFVVTRLKYSIAMAGRTVYRIREFSKDNLTPLSEVDLDLSDAVDGRARVTSLLSIDNSIFIALATTVSDQAVNENNDDGALSDIVLIRMRPDWTFDPQKDVQTISAEPNDSYKQSVGSPPSGRHRAWIKIFDRDFNLVHQEEVLSVVWGPGGGEIRPSLELIGDRILSGQSKGLGIGRGNAEIYVYEINRR
ncbi:MAG: hypothetical protein HY235_10460 [Acidobacteria bacterium]|nr:hypothetical protein [Acidobacteriota bacterium]